MVDTLMGVYLLVLFLLSVLAAWRFPKTELATRFISGFIWLGLLTELTGLYAAYNYSSNAPIYNVSCIIEFGLICLYFNYSISFFQRNRIGIILALLGIGAGITTIIAFDCFYTTNSNFLFLECMGIICMSLYAIFKLLLLNTESLQPYRKVQFWVPLILVLYQVGSLWSWMMYEYYRLIGDNATHNLHHMLLSNGILTYLLFSLFYLYYPTL